MIFPRGFGSTPEVPDMPSKPQVFSRSPCQARDVSFISSGTLSASIILCGLVTFVGKDITTRNTTHGPSRGFRFIKAKKYSTCPTCYRPQSQPTLRPWVQQCSRRRVPYTKFQRTIKYSALSGELARKNRRVHRNGRIQSLHNGYRDQSRFRRIEHGSSHVSPWAW